MTHGDDMTTGSFYSSAGPHNINSFCQGLMQGIHFLKVFPEAKTQEIDDAWL